MPCCSLSIILATIKLKRGSGFKVLRVRGILALQVPSICFLRALASLSSHPIFSRLPSFPPTGRGRGRTGNEARYYNRGGGEEGLGMRLGVIIGEGERKDWERG